MYIQKLLDVPIRNMALSENAISGIISGMKQVGQMKLFCDTFGITEGEVEATVRHFWKVNGMSFNLLKDGLYFAQHSIERNEQLDTLKSTMVHCIDLACVAAQISS